MVVRTTLTLDDDVLAVAKAVAAAEGVSLGAVVSRLARQGMTSTARVIDDAELPTFSVPPDVQPLTPEMVRAALDDV